MKLYDMQKKCCPKSECELSKYCMKKEYSWVTPACIVDFDNIEETVEERKRRWEKKNT